MFHLLVTDDVVDLIVEETNRWIAPMYTPNSSKHWMKEAEGSKRKARKRCVGSYE